MNDLKNSGCDFLTIGQYLRPRIENTAVVEYIRPEVFEEYRIRGLEMGFNAVASSPLTRSSMNAGEMYKNTNSKFEYRNSKSILRSNTTAEDGQYRMTKI